MASKTAKKSPSKSKRAAAKKPAAKKPAAKKPRKKNPVPIGPDPSEKSVRSLSARFARGPHPALRKLTGKAKEIGAACYSLRPWPVFVPAQGADRVFSYVPWLARYYGIQGKALRDILSAWEVAGLAQLLVDDDRARVMGEGDKRLCPRTADGGIVVWARF